MREREGLKLDLTRAGMGRTGAVGGEERLAEAERKLAEGKEGCTGWVKLPQEYDSAELERILETAEEIRGKCQAFVVIGIGGSYLGARACVELLSHSFRGETEDVPRIYFAGQNISGTYHAELLEVLKDKETCLCVISKSGTTTEPSIAFALLKDAMVKKYGEKEAAKRIYAITDGKKGVLREETEREGYVSFVVPDDIGGRYSVLTAVGLLPIAVAGIDVKEMLRGAADFAGDHEGHDLCRAYASARVALYECGKSIEIYEAYEPKLQFFTEWLKQLFGESEGKGGKGLFPAALQFSGDLHSMGQFLQQGSQIFFETVLNVVNPEKDLTVPESAGALLAGKRMNEVNQAAVRGVMAAHEQAGIPMIEIDIPSVTAYDFGRLVYFFERACALSGYMIGVNPFDQPGVESYKNEMRNCLRTMK